MQIVHGTWIPAEPADFVQRGTFALWVETDAPVHHRRRSGDERLHPRHLSYDALDTFLVERLKMPVPYGGSLARLLAVKSMLLPTANGVPVPSAELLPYVEDDVPEECELRPWQVCCYPLR